jgi:hypothetical protein
MYIKLKSLLTEAMEKLFHATNLNKLLEILKSDALKFTYADGTSSDAMINQGYPFYLSTSREKYGGYARSGNYPVTLVLNGPAIKNVRGIKMASVDYWGSMARTGESETEERIFNQKQSVVGLKKYVSEIFIFLDVNFFNPEKESPSNAYIRLKHTIYPLIDALESSGIPCYFYIGDRKSKAFTAYKMQRKEMSHDETYVKDYLKNIENNSNKLKQFLSSANPEDLMPYTSSTHYSKIHIKELEFISKLISDPELFADEKFDPTDKDLKRIIDYFIYYTNDLVPSISAKIHNMRDKHPEIFQVLAKSVRKHKYKDIKEALLKTSNILKLIGYIKKTWEENKSSPEIKFKKINNSYLVDDIPTDKRKKLMNILQKHLELELTDSVYKEIADTIR